MNKFLIVICFIASFFLTSCNNQKDYKSSYEKEDYETVLQLAPDILKTNFNAENLSYALMAAYKTGDMKLASQLALLYTYSFKEFDNNQKVSLIILMYNDKTIEAFYAGQKLINNYKQLTITDYSTYYKLASLYDLNEANSFYNSISSKLFTKDKLIILANGNPTIVQILTLLESYYAETEGNSDYQALLAQYLEIVSKRGINSDGSLIINLAENTLKNKPKGELYLGDIYYKLGLKTKAVAHWNNAMEEYPAEVKSRLFM